MVGVRQVIAIRPEVQYPDRSKPPDRGFLYVSRIGLDDNGRQMLYQGIYELRLALS